MLKQLILVGLGGGIGSVFRYLTSLATAKYLIGQFPIATFLANIFGCLILGFCVSLFSKNPDDSENLRLLFITGFCGGYTTFSTFAFENVQFLQQENYGLLVTYTLASILVGLAAIFIGISFGKYW